MASTTARVAAQLRLAADVELALGLPEPLRLHEPHGDGVVGSVECQLERVLLLGVAGCGGLLGPQAEPEAHVLEHLHREPLHGSKQIEGPSSAPGGQVCEQHGRVDAHSRGHGFS